jgi:hypothetical protein
MLGLTTLTLPSPWGRGDPDSATLTYLCSIGTY